MASKGCKGYRKWSKHTVRQGKRKSLFNQIYQRSQKLIFRILLSRVRVSIRRVCLQRDVQDSVWKPITLTIYFDLSKNINSYSQELPRFCKSLAFLVLLRDWLSGSRTPSWELFSLMSVPGCINIFWNEGFTSKP